MNVELISPFPFEALPRVHKWISRFREQVADDFAPKTLDEFVGAMTAKWGHQRTWAICGDGELGGLIAFDRLSPWLGTAHVILKPDFHGKGIAVKAFRQAVSEMFETGIGKLSFYPFAGNLAMGSLLSNIGAKREGMLEGHTLCNGTPRDMWLYGLRKESFEEKYNALANTGHHRSGSLDRGLVPVGETEDFDQHKHEQPELHPVAEPVV